MRPLKIRKLVGDAPILRKVRSGGQWEYAQDWTYEVHTNEGVLRFTAKAGTRTDLASVPKWLRGLVDNGSGSYAVLVAACLHDLGYSCRILSRLLIDQLFRDVMIKLGMVRAKAWVYYSAVRIGGCSAYESGQADPLASIAWDAK